MNAHLFNTSQVSSHTARNRTVFNACTLFILAFFLGGCASKEEISKKHIENTPPYRPTNVFSVPSLPENIRRIAVLPVYGGEQPIDTRNMLTSQQATALSKTNRFEAMVISGRDMSSLFGRDTFTSTEVLPNDLFEVLKKRYAADAVLFTELTQYDPYQPIRIGIRMNLVSIENAKPLWAFDDVFNAGDFRVMSGAEKYQNLNGRNTFPINSGSSILKSPSLFSGYVFQTAFSTLPMRGTGLETINVTRPDAMNPNERPNPSDRTTSEHPAIPAL